MNWSIQTTDGFFADASLNLPTKRLPRRSAVSRLRTKSTQMKYKYCSVISSVSSESFSEENAVPSVSDAKSPPPYSFDPEPTLNYRSTIWKQSVAQVRSPFKPSSDRPCWIVREFFALLLEICSPEILEYSPQTTRETP